MENHHFLKGKSTISMSMFNSKLLVYQRVLPGAKKNKNKRGPRRWAKETSEDTATTCYHQWHGSRNKAMELVKCGIEVPKLDVWSYEERYILICIYIYIYVDVKRCWVLRDIWASCPFSPSPLCSIFFFEWSHPSLMSSQDKGAAQRAATPSSSPLVSLARTKLDSAIQVVCKKNFLNTLRSWNANSGCRCL